MSWPSLAGLGTPEAPVIAKSGCETIVVLTFVVLECGSGDGSGSIFDTETAVLKLPACVPFKTRSNAKLLPMAGDASKAESEQVTAWPEIRLLQLFPD